MHIPHKGLTGFQVCAIVTLSVIGISVMFIPQRATHSSGVDGVLVTFIAGILSIVLAGMIILSAIASKQNHYRVLVHRKHLDLCMMQYCSLHFIGFFLCFERFRRCD